MLINRDEMIEEFERQIRKFGGAWSFWLFRINKHMNARRI